MERQTTKGYSQSIHFYKEVLDYVSGTQGDGKNYRQDERKLDVRMKVGNIYAVRANDDPNYFFTITLQNDPFTGGFRKLISQVPDLWETLHQEWRRFHKNRSISNSGD